MYVCLPVCLYVCLSVHTDTATVSDLIGLTLWKYIEETKEPIKLVRLVLKLKSELVFFVVVVVCFRNR